MAQEIEGTQVFEIARDIEALEKAYKILRGSSVLGGDTETGGFQPHINRLWSLQLSNGEYSVLVPFNHLKTIGPLQELLLDESIIKVFHNGKFDLKFLKFNGIDVVNVYDTLITEKLIKAGIEYQNTSGSGSGASLKVLAKRYLNYEMSKDERSDFYDGTFFRENKRNSLKVWTSERIDYALDDVWVLPLIRQAQLKLIREQGLSELLEKVEQPLIPIVARMEFLGVTLDEARTQDFGNRMQEKADALRQSLTETFEPLWQQYWRPLYAEEMKVWNAWEVPHKQIKRKATKKWAEKNWEREREQFWKDAIAKAVGKAEKDIQRKSRDAERDSWIDRLLEESKPALLKSREEKPFQFPPKERKPINITSNQQLEAALAQAGVYVPNMQKVTLEDMAGQNEVLDLLLDFRKYEKLAKYRTILIDGLNQVTNRIHPDINQIVSTGRFSISGPPLQQIPVKSDEGKELRSCFIAPSGRRIVSADYSAIELVLIGALSKDENLLEAIRKQSDKDFDLHAWTMSKFLQVPYESLMEVKQGFDSVPVAEARDRFESEVQIPDLTEAETLAEWFKKLRDVIKTLTYGIAYGLSEFGLSRKFHMSKDSAVKIIELFYVAYPGVKRFILKAGELGLKLGYSKTPMGRRRNFSIPPMPTSAKAAKEVMEELIEEGRAWADVPRLERERLISRRLWQKKKEREWMIEAIKRQAANAPIQGASADMTKTAMVIFERKTRHFPYEDFLRLTVHDELLAEVGVERADEAAAILEESMIEAAYTFLPKDIPIKAEAKISTHWDK